MEEFLTVKRLKGILDSIKDEAMVVVHVNDNEYTLGPNDHRAQFGFFILTAKDENNE